MKNYRKQFKKNIEEVKLSENEKSELFSNFKMMMDNNPLPHIEPIASPFIPSFSHFKKYAYVGLASFLMIGIGTSYAAEFTAPGDILYPIKTIVNDTAINATAFSSEAKVNAKIKLVERRIGEIKDLVEHDEAKSKDIEKINKKIKKYNDDVSEVVNESIADNDTEEQEQHEVSIARFEAVISTHRALVKSIEDKIADVENNNEEEKDIEEGEVVENPDDTDVGEQEVSGDDNDIDIKDENPDQTDDIEVISDDADSEDKDNPETDEDVKDSEASENVIKNDGGIEVITTKSATTLPKLIKSLSTSKITADVNSKVSITTETQDKESDEGEDSDKEILEQLNGITHELEDTQIELKALLNFRLK